METYVVTIESGFSSEYFSFQTALMQLTVRTAIISQNTVNTFLFLICN